MAEKKEKPVSRIAVDLGINENMLRRWIQASRESEVSGLQAFPDHGRPKDAELARLRKENKALREANEIPKKRRSSSRKGNPNNGVSIHERESKPIHH